MTDKENSEELLERVNALQRELEYLKRGIIRNLATLPRSSASSKLSLFGSVRGGDITDKMIEDAKQSLFRGLEDI